MNLLREGCAVGYECLAARADLLDRINVFPVADSDTGTNLRLSLAPLRDRVTDGAILLDQMARGAAGNSGNIAAAFLREFLAIDGGDDLAERAARGRTMAWRAVTAPRTGTMLSVFDSLAATLALAAEPQIRHAALTRALHRAVLATTQALPDLDRAGVVDAGALGMFIFFEGFSAALTGQPPLTKPLADLFPGRLAINPEFEQLPTHAHCVNALLRTGTGEIPAAETLANLGESVVVLPREAGLKLHIHTPDLQGLRTKLAACGEIVAWSDEAIDGEEKEAVFRDPSPAGDMHIMSDAAGSISRETARRYGMTLLDSYVVCCDQARPESLCDSGEIYGLMRRGNKVTTAQASTFERHQHYRSVCEQFSRTLYLCVGSAFTGNYATVMAWKKDHDPDNLLTVIDTGAASGRLGIIALLVARHARQGTPWEDIVAFARRTLANSSEYVFIDTLKYLTAGGRISKTGGFFADLLHLKPIITPTAEGVRKAGVVRSREGQLAFALEKLSRRFAAGARPLVMLQYSDNEKWVATVLQPRVQQLLPEAEILLTPLSLTSGVHMGPDTWSVAFSPVP